MTKGHKLLDKYFDCQEALWSDSGQYQYWLNDSLSDVVECWRRGINDDGERVIHSVRHSREYQVTLGVNQHKGESWQVSSMFLNQKDMPTLNARYFHEANRWQHHQDYNGEQHEQSGLVYQPNHFFPLLRVFCVDMLVACESQMTQFLLPDIEIDTPTEEKLRLKQDVRQSNVKHKEGQQVIYSMLGGHYQAQNASFTVDQGLGLLEAYEWWQDDNHRWSIKLKRDTR